MLRAARARQVGHVYLLLLAVCSICCSQCLASVCGDGIIEGHETCDDRNNRSHDGCSSLCTLETGFSCFDFWLHGVDAIAKSSQSDVFLNTTCSVVHGDGIRVGSERCDDGNFLRNDGCYCNMSSAPGVCTVENGWTCDRVSDVSSSVFFRTSLADVCHCSLHEESVSSLVAYSPALQSFHPFGQAGASAQVGCSSCTCDSFGTCTKAELCNWKQSCNGHGFCNFAGQCVCFGNFTGPSCDRCICDHYGSNCSKFCSAALTCSGQGYCNSGGECVGLPLCQATNVNAPVCGDGKRNGAEECDDGNSMDGDGCSKQCTTELGFLCLGGCQETGDVRRRYGECQKDSCIPVACGWHLMSSQASAASNSSQGALGALDIVAGRFLAKEISHSQPLAGSLNILMMRLHFNIPVWGCLQQTSTILVPVTNKPWLNVWQEITTDCKTPSSKATIVISGLLGGTNEDNPALAKEGLISVRRGCSSGKMDCEAR